ATLQHCPTWIGKRRTAALAMALLSRIGHATRFVGTKIRRGFDVAQGAVAYEHVATFRARLGTRLADDAATGPLDRGRNWNGVTRAGKVGVGCGISRRSAIGRRSRERNAGRRNSW